MDFSSFLDGIPDLTDLELAVLLCLVAREHCLIETERDALDDLEKELRLVLYTCSLCLPPWLIVSRSLLVFLDFLAPFWTVPLTPPLKTSAMEYWILMQ